MFMAIFEVHFSSLHSIATYNKINKIVYKNDNKNVIILLHDRAITYASSDAS